jgi:EAL domain-containing protein (putative c-di-GMP-specific phosphodiesterase class I)
VPALGCERGQGYYFARPLSLEALERLLRASPEDLDAPHQLLSAA